MTPRAITGFGVVSTIGIGRSEFVASMRAPVSLIDMPAVPVEAFDGAAYPGIALAEVRGFDPAKFLGDKGLRSLDRLTKLLVVAARLALHDAGIKADNAYVRLAAERVGLCCSNAYGSLEAITETDRVATLEDPRYINPAKFPNTVANSAAGYVSIWEDVRALNVAISDGNCGALDAIACADVFLETGRADAILVGGGEAMSEPLFVAFKSLGALSLRTRLGEAAVLFAMETQEGAAARGARVLAEVTGYGTAFIAPESATLIHASEEAMTRAVSLALADAGIEAKDVDVVATSVSGIEVFDRAELGGIAKVLGPGVCLAAPKSVVGETLGATGGMGMAAVLAWLEGAPVVPILEGAPPARVETALVTTIGYYGNASAVVLRRARRGGVSAPSA